MSAPIVAADLWRPVMEAADYRCQCSGECGNPHRSDGGRCPHMHDSYIGHGRRVRLIAAPVDPLTPQTRATRLGAEELRAWCPECFSRTGRVARRSRPAEPEPTLFELPD